MRWQSEIDQNHFRFFFREGFHGRRTVLGFGDVEVSAERPAQLRTDVLVVINDQNLRLQFKPPASGSSTRNVVPAPSFDCTSILPPCASTIILLWNIPMPM